MLARTIAFVWVFTLVLASSDTRAQSSVSEVYAGIADDLRSLDRAEIALLRQYGRGGFSAIDENAIALVTKLEHLRDRAIRAARRQEPAINSTWKQCVDGTTDRQLLNGTDTRLTMLLLADARMRLEQGDPDRTVEDYEAMLGLIAQFAASPGLSSMPRAASMIPKMLLAPLTRAIDHGQLTSDHARRLLDTLKRINLDDPVRASWRLEHMIEVFLSAYAEAETAGNIEYIRKIITFWTGEDAPPVNAADLLAMRSAITILQTKLAAFITGPIARDDTEAVMPLIDDFLATSHGSLAPWMRHTSSWVHASESARTNLLLIEASLNDLALNGALASRNAGDLYAHAAECLYEIDRHTLEACLTDPDSVDEEVREHVEECLKVFTEASMLERCDFVVLRRPAMTPSQPVSVKLFHDYALAMTDAIRLMHVKIERLSAATPPYDDVVDLLVAVLGIERHLAADEWITSSALTHRAFKDTLKLIEEHWSLFDSRERSVIRQQLQKLDEQSVFGWSASIDQCRGDLAAALAEVVNRILPSKLDPNPRNFKIEDFEAQAEAVRRRSNAIKAAMGSVPSDEIASWMLITDAMERAGYRGKELQDINPRDIDLVELPHHPWVDEIVDRQNANQCARRGVGHLPMILLEWQNLWQLDVPVVMPLRTLREDARQTIRQSQQWLGSHQTP